MSKAPTQSHLEYLLSTVEHERDINVGRLGPLLRTTLKLYEDHLIDENQVRNGLLFLKTISLPVVENKYRTEQLLNATIEYIINPNLTIKDHLRS